MLSTPVVKNFKSVFINPRTGGGLSQLRTGGGGRVTAPPRDLENEAT